MKRLEEGDMQTVRIPLTLLISTFQTEKSELSGDQASQLEVEQ